MMASLKSSISSTDHRFFFRLYPVSWSPSFLTCSSAFASSYLICLWCISARLKSFSKFCCCVRGIPSYPKKPRMSDMMDVDGVVAWLQLPWKFWFEICPIVNGIHTLWNQDFSISFATRNRWSLINWKIGSNVILLNYHTSGDQLCWTFIEKYKFHNRLTFVYNPKSIHAFNQFEEEGHAEQKYNHFRLLTREELFAMGVPAILDEEDEEE